MTVNSAELTAWDIQEWIAARIAAYLKMSRDDISSEASFSELGLSSLQSVELAAELEDWSGQEIPATMVFDTPTIEQAAAYVLGGAHR